MPKIFLIRNRIEEQQLKLRAAAGNKNGGDVTSKNGLVDDADGDVSPYSTDGAASSGRMGAVYPHLLALLKNDGEFQLERSKKKPLPTNFITFFVNYFDGLWI
jgi:hypothetical protein